MFRHPTTAKKRFKIGPTERGKIMRNEELKQCGNSRQKTRLAVYIRLWPR